MRIELASEIKREIEEIDGVAEILYGCNAGTIRASDKSCLSCVGMA